MNAVEHVFWELWIGAFSARQDAYVLNSGVTVSDPLNASVCDAAEQAGHSVSGYLARPDVDRPNRYETHVGAIDVDTVWEDVERVSDYLWLNGVPNLRVRSRRGGHVWMWAHGDGTHGTTKHWPVDASMVRRALNNARMQASDPAHVEVFPKPGRGSGALRMPLFKHPKDGVVYPVVSPERHEVTDRQEVYKLICGPEYWTPYDALWRLAGDEPPLTTYPGGLAAHGRPQTVVVPAGLTVSGLLQAMGITNAHPGRSVRCPWHDDQHASLSIFTDDQRALCHVADCLAFNNGHGIGSLAMARLSGGRQ